MEPENQHEPEALFTDVGPDVPAKFWLRGGAYMIDGLLVTVAGFLCSLILPDALSPFVRLALSAAYFTVLPVRWNGQTVGKRAAGISIVRNDGSYLGYGRLLLRWVGYILSVIPAGLGFLCAPFTPDKRALHDFIAGTKVVRAEEISGARKFAIVGAGTLLPLIAVLGIIAAIMIPSLTRYQTLAQSAVTRSRLVSLRTAAELYKVDNNGRYPVQLGDLATPKYATRVEAVSVPDHPESEGVEAYGADVCSGSKEPGQELLAGRLKDSGHWGYVADPAAPCYGRVFIDCTHQDPAGKEWFRY